jgi:hypothetical protein
MKARPRTTTIRITAAQARCLLHALDVLSSVHEVPRPDEINELAAVIRTAIT